MPAVELKNAREEVQNDTVEVHVSGWWGGEGGRQRPQVVGEAAGAPWAAAAPSAAVEVGDGEEGQEDGSVCLAFKFYLIKSVFNL